MSEGLPNWLSQGKHGSFLLSVYVQPGGAQTAWMGEFNGALKLRLAAPPVDGKANAALCTFLAKSWGVPKSAVSIVSGQTSRQKRVEITGASNEACQAFLAQHMHNKL